MLDRAPVAVGVTVAAKVLARRIRSDIARKVAGAFRTGGNEARKIERLAQGLFVNGWSHAAAAFRSVGRQKIPFAASPYRHFVSGGDVN